MYPVFLVTGLWAVQGFADPFELHATMKRMRYDQVPCGERQQRSMLRTPWDAQPTVMREEINGSAMGNGHKTSL